MSLHMKIAMCAVAFPCTASIVQAFTPLWVFLTLIICGMLTTSFGLALAQRQAKHAELVRKMDKAFGKPNSPKDAWTAKDLHKLKGGFK